MWKEAKLVSKLCKSTPQSIHFFLWGLTGSDYRHCSVLWQYLCLNYFFIFVQLSRTYINKHGLTLCIIFEWLLSSNPASLATDQSYITVNVSHYSTLRLPFTIPLIITINIIIISLLQFITPGPKEGDERTMAIISCDFFFPLTVAGRVYRPLPPVAVFVLTNWTINWQTGSTNNV